MKKTVPGLARIQNTLNSGESSYDSWCITIRGALRFVVHFVLPHALPVIWPLSDN